jgi:hypothetical protein
MAKVLNLYEAKTRLSSLVEEAAAGTEIIIAKAGVPPNHPASCATAVLIDPASGNRIAHADPRRDCYAMAY